MLHCLDDELIVLTQVEDAAARPGVRQLLQRLVTQRQLQEETKLFNNFMTGLIYVKTFFCSQSKSVLQTEIALILL